MPSSRKPEAISNKFILVRIVIILPALEAARVAGVRLLGYAAGLTRFAELGIVKLAILRRAAENFTFNPQQGGRSRR
jgi:hypothetical protein